MSINISGMDAKVRGGVVQIEVAKDASFVALSNLMDWKSIQNLAMVDLKKTAKGFWWLGRTLYLRIHLGVYVLQALLNKTDRAMEEEVKSNALYQIFCGQNVVDNWSVPHATKIEEFRNRLAPETHHAIGELVLKFARAAKFTNAKWMDIDSTAQEANISYPSDANLMLKLAKKAKILVERVKGFGKKVFVDIKKIAGKAKEYFFMAKNTAIEKRRRVFAELHHLVKKELQPVVNHALELSEKKVSKFSNSLRKLYQQVCLKGPALLRDIGVFIKTHSMVPTKILSLHAEAVACIKKGKLGKPFEFGRVYQLARLPGNFMMILKAQTLREDDKVAIPRALEAHAKIFGGKKTKSVAADKGYASCTNVRALKKAGVREIGLQIPSNWKKDPTGLNEKDSLRLRDRRAGIEPLIGHLKRGGLGKSRMKSDQTTEAAAYRATAGFNLRQIVRHMNGEFQ